jgi:uncharacterized protein (DUF983 family)
MAHMAAMAEMTHPLLPSVSRGLKGRCPACGEGRLFWRYLKVSGRCPRCEHELARYPADDGPAYVTVLLTGHLIVAPLLLFPALWRAPVLYSVPIAVSSLALIMLLALPRIKGGWIGLMYALGVKGQDARLHTADAAD